MLGTQSFLFFIFKGVLLAQAELSIYRGKRLQLDERDQGSMRSLVGKCFEYPVRKHIKELQVPCCWGAQGSHEGWGEQAKEGPVRLAWRASWRRG